jgi:CRP/FNR family transcriptional regulator, cyclic AMP receptor protein
VSVRERRLPAGTIVFRQGDAGEDMFVVASGRVQLTMGTGGHEKVIGVLEPGDFFGEMTLLSGAPRSATAVATADTTLVCVGREVFAIMMQDDLEVVFRMMDTIRARLVAADERFQALAERWERVRVTAELLRRGLASDDDRAVTGDASDLAASCGASAEAVSGTLGALAADQGVTIEGQRFAIPGRAGARRLAESLVRALQWSRD